MCLMMESFPPPLHDPFAYGAEHLFHVALKKAGPNGPARFSDFLFFLFFFGTIAKSVFFKLMSKMVYFSQLCKIGPIFRI
jgi:hypothetical protein